MGGCKNKIMLVYVINENSKPLMPCKPAKARHLLREGKAKVVRRTPFTIKLTFRVENRVQKTILGIDPGSKKMGTVVRRKGSNEVLYSSEVTLRGDISSRLKRRASYRRNRRNRKTRYRQPRFLNRKSAFRGFGDWLPPSVASKVDSHKKEIRFILKLLPISEIKFEYSKFDTHKIKNPRVSGFWYQKGEMYGWENTKAYVLTRDGYKCKLCGKKNAILDVHHIIWRSKGGGNKPSNLLTVCHDNCHLAIHKKGKKIPQRVIARISKNTKDATQTSIISKRVWSWLRKLGKKAVKTYGFITKTKRRILRFKNKSHILDAYCISLPVKTRFRKKFKRIRNLNSLFKSCVNKGDYQQTKGRRSEKRISTGKIHGFRKFDTVNYLGKTYAIKGRRSTGYAVLMNHLLETVKLKPTPKFSKMLRIQGRTSWIIFQKVEQNT